MIIKCKSCGSDLEYDYNQIFTHWDYPYVICPKCCDVILVPSDIKEILKGREALNKKMEINKERN